MPVISRLATSSLLVLLTATLTTAAYARGGGHAGSNGSSSPPVHSSSLAHSATVHSATIHSSTVHSGKTIVSKPGGKKLPNGPVALGGASHQPKDVVVRQHCAQGQICNTYGNWQGEGGLPDGDVPARDQSHQTGPGGQVNDHRTVVHDHRTGG